jgi:predicted component of viral defense system (DUF524 family)
MRINLSHIKPNLYLDIEEEKDDTLLVISDEDVIEYGEAKYQLLEGCNYEYQFSDESITFKKREESSKNAIISHSKFGKNKGSINPNIYVGTHTLEIEGSPLLLPIEVRSVKASYRQDYRFMLESICEKCTDLIMQIDSPINQNFETNYDTDSQTLYQRFSFVKSIIGSLEFEEAIQKIISNPTTKWEEEFEEKDIRSIRRFNQRTTKQLVTRNNRLDLGENHYLRNIYGLSSIPTKIYETRKIESTDTAENQFIKHTLEDFLFFCENCELKFAKFSTAKTEANALAAKLSSLLNQSFFKEISRPTSLKLNSPVLQRKSGYREVLNAWLKFDLAAKLIWKGGENVYSAGKKDIATLYEYWLFFTLLDLLKEVFDIEPKSISQLIHFDNGLLSLTLKQGTAIALQGIYKSHARNLNIQFSYNRSFGGGKVYPEAGSYTTTLRPDYTLSIWPAEIKDPKAAEMEELITHIHFDAKYKVNNFYALISKSKEEVLTEEENIELFNDEAEEIKKGTFKNQDLLKMHAYKDAIRRTAGAYVLYPGEGEDAPFRGFHELIPGLGAFVVKPNNNSTDKEHLKTFLNNVISNFTDRASQRDHTAVKIYEIHQNVKSETDILNEPLPEYVNSKKLIPSETFVLVGYYKGESHLNWIKQKGVYNVRYNDRYNLQSNDIAAQYLLLYSKDQSETTLFFKLKKNEAKIYTKSELKYILNYPTNPSQDTYLVFSLDKEIEKEFEELKIDLTKISVERETKRPQSIDLITLLKAKIHPV